LLYVDSNVFLYPIVYDSEVIVEACTATVTWDEIAWTIRKIFGFELSVEKGLRELNPKPTNSQGGADIPKE